MNDKSNSPLKLLIEEMRNHISTKNRLSDALIKIDKLEAKVKQLEFELARTLLKERLEERKALLAMNKPFI